MLAIFLEKAYSSFLPFPSSITEKAYTHIYYCFKSKQRMGISTLPTNKRKIFFEGKAI